MTLTSYLAELASTADGDTAGASNVCSEEHGIDASTAPFIFTTTGDAEHPHAGETTVTPDVDPTNSTETANDVGAAIGSVGEDPEHPAMTIASPNRNPA